MRKLFTILSICIFTANYCFASGIELSDLIETARETEVQQTIQEQPVSDVTKQQTQTVNTEETMTPVKNGTTSPIMDEMQAVEKVSPNTTTIDTQTKTEMTKTQDSKGLTTPSKTMKTKKTKN